MSGSVGQPPAGASDLATSLRSNKDRILDAWEHAVRALPSARELPRPELVEFIPPLLDQLADLLDPSTVGHAAEPPPEIGEQHAFDRLEEGFDLREVVTELSLLRECVLRLWHEGLRTDASTWSQDAVLIQAIDRSIAVTIEHYVDSRERLIEALNRVSSIALESANLEELLDQLITTIEEQLPAVDTAAIFLREDGVVRLKAASGLERELTAGFAMPIGEGFAGTIAATGRPLHLRSAAHDPRVRSAVVQERGVNALYGVPLMHAGEVVGVANMGSTTTSTFSNQDRILFDAMVGRAAAAISQRILRDQVEAHARKLEKALHEAEAGRALRESLTLQLQEREERLRLVIDATGIGAFDFYPQTGRLEWSSHAKAHFGLPPNAEVSYETFLRGVHPDDRARIGRLVENVLQPGSSGEYDTEYRVIGLEDRKERWLAARGVVTFDVRGNAERFIGFTLDITARKRAEEHLRESDRRKDQFLAVLGHELRNPLSAIRNAIELIKGFAPDHEGMQRAAGVLDRQSNVMTRLVDGLLEVSRIGRGKIDLDRETLDLTQLVEALVHDRMPQVQERGLELRVAIASSPLWVFGDRVRLVQVLDNLLGNAIKFTPPPGSIDLEVETANGSVVIVVRDTGVGIRQEMLGRIFDPFEQEAHDVARTSGGLGLGLALAKGLVELHRGSIEAHSAGTGTGTQIEVRLPLAAVRRDVDQPPLIDRPWVPPRRILIVEDNPDAAQMLHDLLELWGHEASAVDNALAALDTLRRAPTDLILCDLGLPGMSGYDLAREVRRDPTLHDIPIVALTGHGQPEDRGRTAEAGFDEHLLKPVDPDTLNDVLLRLGGEGHHAHP